MMERFSQVQGKEKLAGVFFGILAYGSWGFLPLYWKLLKQIPSEQILAYRIVLSCLFIFSLLAVRRNLGKLAETVKNRRKLVLLLFCSVLICINWGIYIWAVNSGHIVEASMGYYINPLMSIFLGIAVLRERLGLPQFAALAFAAAGVFVMAVRYGSFPWIAVILAVTFALYGLFKKLAAAESMVGLAVETAVTAPAALIFLSAVQLKGEGALGHIPMSVALLLLFAGVATTMPLLWFAKAAGRIELSTIGFLQYISPTISLLLGIFVYHEAFTGEHALGFGFIWCALVIYSLAQVGVFRRFRTVRSKRNTDNQL
jgi:chloramphenicol-sensitive protein RarD